MTCIGDYELGNTLGQGTFGIVKAATSRSTSRQVAIKIVPASKADHKLEQEIENQRQLHHKHVVEILEVIKDGDDTYIVMELVSGGDLFDFIVRHVRLPEEEARHAFQQIIAGVEHCHDNKIVHRDLKPENIFMDSNSNIKIGDFGFAGKIVDGELFTESCGSPNYAAPEFLIKNCQYKGPQVDIWSCGVILYALLCNQLPFDSDTIQELFRLIKRGQYSVPGFVSDDAKDLIRRMLTVDPTKRISIAEIRKHPWFVRDLPAELDKSIPETKQELEECADGTNSVLEKTVKSLERLSLSPLLSVAELLLSTAQEGQQPQKSLAVSYSSDHVRDEAREAGRRRRRNTTLSGRRCCSANEGALSARSLQST
jgi:5'-AMP-activated protein kinase catalytic alpha subunit